MKCSGHVYLPIAGPRAQPFKDGPASLSAGAAGNGLGPHQIPPPLSKMAEGPVIADPIISAVQR